VFTDRTALTTRGYADHRPLATRLSIYDWQVDRVDLPGLAVQALAGVRGTVLDAGSGLGTYVDRLHRDRPDLAVLALDLSPGMRPMVAGDIARLPLADGSVDAALAMHMLYHVPDIAAAAAELRRVVADGGVVLASTNGRDDKREIGALWAAAVADLTGSAVDEPDADSRFTLDDGDVLRTAFDSAEVMAFDRETLVPEVEPVVAFVDSMRGLSEDALPGGVTWEAFLGRVRARVQAEIDRAGVFRITNQVGVFTCR
jgi:SAM-dependent methyltransferase